MAKHEPIYVSSPQPSAITVKIEDGQTLTFRPEAVLAILSKPEGRGSTIILDGGMKLALKGTGEGLRKRVFGTTPEEVKAAVKQQAARPTPAKGAQNGEHPAAGRPRDN